MSKTWTTSIILFKAEENSFLIKMLRELLAEY